MRWRQPGWMRAVGRLTWKMLVAERHDGGRATKKAHNGGPAYANDGSGPTNTCDMGVHRG